MASPSDPARDEARRTLLASLGASADDCATLLEYGANRFDPEAVPDPLTLPLPDEPFCTAWDDYVARAGVEPVLEVLRAPLVQLGFPVRAGISQTDAYRAATRRGVPPEALPEATGIQLNRPEALELSMHASPAGRVPVISTGDRRDFETLVQALLHRSEPVPVPPSMGACMVAGFNNWDRVHRLETRWRAEHPGDDDSGWAEAFRRIIPEKERYQDRFMILSDGPYSAVSAADMGLSEQAWQHASMDIRREHECTHYFTRRVFGTMNDRIMDELMADCMGILLAAGRYRADWFLRFMGLEDFPRYRPGGRLENYRGEPPLSDAAFVVLQRLVSLASGNLERFTEQHLTRAPGVEEKAVLLMALARLTLEDLASEHGVRLLAEHAAAVRRLSGMEPCPSTP